MNLKSSIKSKKRLHYGQIVTAILNEIADFLIEDGRASHRFGPRADVILGYIIKIVLEKHKFEESQVKQAIKSLEKRNVIDVKTVNDQAYVMLEDKGERRIAQYSLAKILDYKRKQKKWNGKWFMVFFDIPEVQRNKRNYLRGFLKSIGFYQYQQSVYIFPFECREEINYLRDIVESAKYTKFIIADAIEDEDKIKTYFKLS